jgi:plasmid stabilization system protein ParE
LRVWRVSGFPNHLVFYIEHSAAIEVVRILHGAMDIESELGKR